MRLFESSDPRGVGLQTPQFEELASRGAVSVISFPRHFRRSNVLRRVIVDVFIQKLGVEIQTTNLRLSQFSTATERLAG